MNVKTNSKLIDKILKASENKYGATVETSELMHNKDSFRTQFPALNIALSGDLDVGMRAGVMQIVGESKSFKTLFMLTLGKAYLDTYNDAVIVLFDSEHGAALEYFESLDIDAGRVIHLPIVSVEDMQIQYSKITDQMTRGEKVFFAIDSLGLLPSAKEAQNAIDGKSGQDFTRTTRLNGFWRTVSTTVPLLDVPLVAINHYYDEIGSMFPKKIIKGGKNGYLVSNTIWIISRSQEKDGTDLIGFNFTINVEKSRDVKEKAKIPITVTFKGGIDKYSGILEIALEGGFIEKPSNGWYQLPGTSNKVRAKDTGPLLEQVCADEKFKEYVRQEYQLASNSLINSDVLESFDDLEETEI